MAFQTIQLPVNLNLPYVFVVAFALILALFWIYNFFVLYHLIRFGVGRLPKQLAVLTLAGSLFLSLLVLIAFFYAYL